MTPYKLRVFRIVRYAVLDAGMGLLVVITSPDDDMSQHSKEQTVWFAMQSREGRSFENLKNCYEIR
jgi:hypothetical protein